MNRLIVIFFPAGKRRAKKRETISVYLFFGVFIGQLIAGGLAAAADREVNQGNIPVMEEVVVTATRHKEKLTSVPANVTILTEKDIKDSSAVNVPELLRSQAGVQVYDINGNRRTYAVDLRGFGEGAATNALVLVDGRRITQPDLSGTDWAQVPLERIERIEIIRGGGGSVLYGDNAAGGVINIITKKGGKLEGGAAAVVGSYHTFRGNVHTGGSGRNYAYYLSGGYGESDGYRTNSQTRGKDVGANLSLFPSDNVSLNLSGGYHGDKTGYPGALMDSDFTTGKVRTRTDSAHVNDFAETKDFYVKGSPEVTFWGESLFRMDLSFRQRDASSFISGSWGDSTYKTKLETVDLSPQLVLKETVAGFQNSLTIGLDLHDAKDDIVSDANSVFSGASRLNATLKKEGQGYYVHDEINVAKNVILSGGYRYDRAKYTMETTAAQSATMRQEAYGAGINYLFAGKSYLYGSYTRGFRYPVLDEFFNIFTNAVADKLIPQQSDDYEVGSRYFFSDKTYVHVNLFRIDTQKEIIANPANFLANENLDGRTQRQGAELSFQTEVASWLSLRGGYTYTKAEIEGGRFAGKDIPGVAKNKAVLGATFLPAKGLTVSVQGSYTGSRLFISDFDNAFSKQEDYYVIDSRIEYRRGYLKGFFCINNVLNKDYNEYGVLNIFSVPVEKGYYPSPERNFLAGLSVDF